MHKVAWSDGRWLDPPVSAIEEGDDLVVVARSGSDFWRTTAYGFVHDNGHALLAPLPAPGAVEVDFVASLDELYDQAGLMLWINETTWLKAGIERSDGVWHVGAVVTRDLSDWSLSPVPDWEGGKVTVRASRSGDAVTLRARVDDGGWQMLRLAPMPADAAASAGPMLCSPLGRGATVRFSRFELGRADTELHGPA